LICFDPPVQAHANLWFLIVGLSSSVLTFLVTTVWKPYLKKYAEEMAKHLATREEFSEFLAQTFQKTYMEEAAKRAITREQIAAIVSEAFQKAYSEEEKVTATTKTIEANISEGYCLRQMVWTEKRETYVRTLQAFADQENGWRMTIEALRRAFKAKEDFRSEIEKEFAALIPELNKKLEEMEKTASIAELMLSVNAANIVLGCLKRLRDVENEPTLLVAEPDSEFDAAQLFLNVCIDILRKYRTDLVIEAKSDLGLNVHMTDHSNQ
jgi:hypothetical protein